MTRKDYELIARVIAALPLTWQTDGSAQTVALAFADALIPTNPHFDRARFLTACSPTTGPNDAKGG